MRAILTKLEQALIALLLAGMILLVFTQIVCRHLGRSFSFTEEINQQMFVWVTVLGMALAAGRRQLLGLTLLSRNSEKRKRRFARVAFASLLLYGVSMVALSVKMVWTQYSTGKTTPAMGWPIWLVGLAVPAGFLLVIAHAVGAYLLWQPKVDKEREIRSSEPDRSR